MHIITWIHTYTCIQYNTYTYIHAYIRTHARTHNRIPSPRMYPQGMIKYPGCQRSRCLQHCVRWPSSRCFHWSPRPETTLHTHMHTDTHAHTHTQIHTKGVVGHSGYTHVVFSHAWQDTLHGYTRRPLFVNAAHTQNKDVCRNVHVPLSNACLA